MHAQGNDTRHPAGEWRSPATDETTSGVNQPRRLRRWSVAELVAQAVSRPSSGGLAQ